MTVVYAICMALVGAASLLTVGFVVRSRGLVDRAVGLDTAVAIVLNGLAIAVATTAGELGIELLLLFSLLGFLGTVSVARFIERRGPTMPAETDQGGRGGRR